MKRFTEQFNKESQKVRMRGFERADLRERLATYMEYHPLPAEMRAKNTNEKPSGMQVRRLFTAVQINSLFVRSFVPTIVVLVIVAVPVLAERAAPGDVLYPVKVRFNEEMRSRLATSPYEEIEWEAERIERRIAEARLLANEGKLTPDLEAEVAAAVKEQTEKTKSKIAALKTTDADEGAIAEITLASALEVQNEMLEADAEKNKAAGIETGTVLASVVAEESSAATAQQEQANPSYEKLLARIETETTNAHEFFSSIKPGAQAEEVADIENRLAGIASKVHEAQRIATTDQPETTIEAAAPVAEVATLETATTAVSVSTTTQSASTTVATDEVEAADSTAEVSGRDAATTLLREALTDIRKLISFMTNIDVRESVTVDELLPETLSEEERRTIIENELAAARAVLADYDALVASSGEGVASSTEKDVLAATVSHIEERLAAGAIDELEGQIKALQEAYTALREYIEAKQAEMESDVESEAEAATSTETTIDDSTAASSSGDIAASAESGADETEGTSS